MNLNWFNKEEDHANSIPADILYLSKRWQGKSKNILIVGGSSKYIKIFEHLEVTHWRLEELEKMVKDKTSFSFDYILCYHSLSELNFQRCDNILSFLSDVLKQNGEIYLTLLSKDSYFYKNKEETNNNLYVSEKQLEKLLNHFLIKNIEYTKRLKPDNKINPHFYILASKK